MEKQNLEASDFDKLERIKYQAFYTLKLKELHIKTYPICLEECLQKHPVTESSNQKLVLNENQLKCTMNCLQKYKGSMNLALAIAQIDMEENATD